MTKCFVSRYKSCIYSNSSDCLKMVTTSNYNIAHNICHKPKHHYNKY